MKTLTKILQKIDNLSPDPWYIDGVKQARLVTQIGMLLGIIIGLFICYLIF